MSFPTAAKGPPLILEHRLALSSAKVFFIFPQLEAEIALPTDEIDTEAKLQNFLDKWTSAVRPLVVLQQAYGVQWQLSRPDGSQISFSNWNIERKAQRCFSATLIPGPEPEPEPQLDSIGPNNLIGIPVSHTYVELRWYEKEESKKKATKTILKTKSVLAPKAYKISDLIDSLRPPLKVVRLEVFSRNSEGSYTSQIYLPQDPKKISELLSSQRLQIALDVTGSGFFPKFES